MMETWYNITIGVTAMFVIVNSLIGQELTVQSMAIIGVLLIESAALWFYNNTKQCSITRQSIYRPNASAGIFSVLLVPMALLGELNSRMPFEDLICHVEEMWLSLAVVAIIIMRLALAENPHCQQIFLVVLSSLGAVLVMLYGWIYIFSLGIFYITWKCLELLPFYLPKSFTFGELAVVLQLIASWINRMSISLFKEQTLSEEDIQLVWFVCTLVIAVIVSTLIVCQMNAYSSLWFFVAVYTVLAAVSLIILQSALHENPVLWLLNFVFNQCTKIILLVTWLILLSVAIVWTVIQSLKYRIHEKDTSAHQHSQKQAEKEKVVTQGSLYVYSSSSFSTTSFTVRKVFHLFIVLVYFPGLVLNVRLLLFASTAAFALLIILEAARALHVPVIGEHLDKIMRTFVDDRDQGLVFLTHIYLLVGMSLPLWISHNLFSSHTSSIELYSGFLSLGVGDTVACVAGKTWGRTHWPGSKKTLEGTMCSIVSQMVLVILGSYIGVLSITNLRNVFTGISLCALAEAFTDQIDNLILPLVIYPLLCIS